jgi:hypothetical protein
MLGQDNWRAAMPRRSATTLEEEEEDVVMEEIGGLDSASAATLSWTAMCWMSAVKSAM